MKNKEDLNALKKEYESLHSRLRELNDDELREVIGGVGGNGVILVCSAGKYKCECGRCFDTMEDLIRHSNEHYESIIL